MNIVLTNWNVCFFCSMKNFHISARTYKNVFIIRKDTFLAWAWNDKLMKLFDIPFTYLILVQFSILSVRSEYITRKSWGLLPTTQPNNKKTSCYIQWPNISGHTDTTFRLRNLRTGEIVCRCGTTIQLKCAKPCWNRIGVWCVPVYLMWVHKSRSGTSIIVQMGWICALASSRYHSLLREEKYLYDADNYPSHWFLHREIITLWNYSRVLIFCFCISLKLIRSISCHKNS